MRRTLFAVLLSIVTLLGTTAFAGTAKEDSVERLKKAGVVLWEFANTPDQGIPKEVLDRTKCLVVVPHLIKAGSIVGGKHVRGVASCRARNIWSAPAFVSVGGGSWALQIGTEGVDLVMLVMNDKGLGYLLSSKFQISGEGFAAAGPVGRHASMDPDWMNAELLIYSRSKGAFAALSLEGAVVEQDADFTTAVYGKDVSFRKLLMGEVKLPAAARPFMVALYGFDPPRPPTFDQSALPPPPPFFSRSWSPVWNVWAERSSALSFKPQSLQRGQEYSLVVNLAALDFRQLEGKGVYSQAGSRSFADWVKRNSDLDSVDVELLVIPDQRYFQVQGERTKFMQIDLKKFRATQKSGFALDGSPFAYLRSHGGEAPFSFGTQFFRLKTAPNAPLGNAPVALSIWADGKPIDEVAMNLCVAAKLEDACPTSSASNGYSLRGVDLSGKGELPDAALHLIERGNDVIGVFRCNACPGGGYLPWTIGQQAGGGLADRVNEVVQHLAPIGLNQDYFTQAGDTLYNLIFPNSQDSDEAAAEKAFGSFFSTAHAKVNAGVPSSLFVRLLSSKPNLVLFPIGLMRIPLPNGSKEFLGFSVNVEAPLELQDYSTPAKCISDWVLFVPPPGSRDILGDLADARAYSSDWIDLMTKSCPNCIYSDPTKFTDWLLENSQPTMPTASQALIVLSQYKNNALYFNGSADNPPSVLSGSIRRSFATPSFAILDACGTAAPGGSEFIRMLNSHGIYSVISTSTAISGPVGGQFLKIFMESLAKHPDYTVSRARYETVKAVSKLRGSDDKPYGPQALVFTLVGNGGLRLCMPN